MLSCSFDPIAGGSASEGEAIVIGTVVFQNTQPAESTVVSLRRISITTQGESVDLQKATMSGQNGAFTLKRVPPGRYALLCEKAKNSVSAIISKITITDKDSSLDVGLIHIKPYITVKGRILTGVGSGLDKAGMKVFIAGTGKKTFTDADGFYTLAGIPQGQYDITILTDTVANYLPVAVEEAGGLDTVFIRDAGFARTFKEADNIYSFYPSKLGNNFSILPKKYEAGNAPDWYEGKDFSFVHYYEIVDDQLKPIWRFSLIVGFSDSLAVYYGGLESVKVLAAKMTSDANDIFNDTTVFKGRIDFAIDSVYRFSGNGSAQLALPPAGYNYRLIFHEASPPTQEYFWGDRRSIYHYYPIGATIDLFGRTSVEDLAWEFALTRGCQKLSYQDVDYDKNPVNGQQYRTKSCFMNNNHSSRVWDYYSINIINRHTDRVFTQYETVIAAKFLPTTIGAVVKSGSGSAVSGAGVKLYGVKWGTYRVDSLPVITGLTGADGSFDFPANPFTLDTSAAMLYSNFVVQATAAQDTAYTWMPVSEAGSAWFANPDTVYMVNLKLSR